MRPIFKSFLTEETLKKLPFGRPGSILRVRKRSWLDFKVLSHHSLGGNEENNEKPQSG
jgi:hypothetical protein